MKDVEYMFIVDDAIVDAVAKFGEIQGVSIKDVAATVRAALGAQTTNPARLPGDAVTADRRNRTQPVLPTGGTELNSLLAKPKRFGIDFYGAYCSGGHPMRRPWQRTLAVTLLGWRIHFTVGAKPIRVPMYVCGKCLGIEKC
jgi:hypothetical protein